MSKIIEIDIYDVQKTTTLDGLDRIISVEVMDPDLGPKLRAGHMLQTTGTMDSCTLNSDSRKIGGGISM